MPPCSKLCRKCLANGDVDRSQCEADFKAAKEQHAKVAPKYTSQADCEADFGAEQCESAPYQTQSGGSVFMPLMMGYMMGSMMSGRGRRIAAVVPLKRCRSEEFPDGGQESRVIRSRALKVARSATRTPSMKSSTVSRGGFARSARPTRLHRLILTGGSEPCSVPVAERDDWKNTARNTASHFHSIDNDPYWDESAYYQFTLRQIEDDLEDPERGTRKTLLLRGRARRGR